jgi:hypothetical protein
MGIFVIIYNDGFKTMYEPWRQYPEPYPLEQGIRNLTEYCNYTYTNVINDIINFWKSK